MVYIGRTSLRLSTVMMASVMQRAPRLTRFVADSIGKVIAPMASLIGINYQIGGLRDQIYSSLVDSATPEIVSRSPSGKVLMQFPLEIMRMRDALYRPKITAPQVAPKRDDIQQKPHIDENPTMMFRLSDVFPEGRVHGETPRTEDIAQTLAYWNRPPRR
jgi:hypothetical protein